MAGKFSLRIISPERVLLEKEVTEVYAPGWKGEFGVLAGHKPYLVMLKVGELRIREENKWLFAAVSGGFCEVDYDSMKILAESCELSTEIDLARAEQAKRRAEEGIKKLHPINDEQAFGLTQAALQRALNRIRVAKRTGE